MYDKDLYKSKLITAAQAAALIKDGDKVVTTFGCCEPLGIEKRLKKLSELQEC